MKRKLTKGEQRAAADILTRLTFTTQMPDVISVYHEVFKDYDLCEDPFTKLPCTPEEYCKNRLEYDRQTMIERYGHCDGLE